jgi:hypothetical protein
MILSATRLQELFWSIRFPVQIYTEQSSGDHSPPVPSLLCARDDFAKLLAARAVVGVGTRNRVRRVHFNPSRPERWSFVERLARPDQIEGLPVVGDPVKLLTQCKSNCHKSPLA